MNSSSLPALEMALALPWVGAAAIALFRNPPAAARFSLTILAALLAGVVALAVDVDPTARIPDGIFAIDAVSGPMLPVLVFLHLLTLLGTAKSRVTPALCIRVLLAAFAGLAIVTCQEPRVLVGLLVVSSLLPYWELRSQRKPSRGFALYMALFSFTLVAGLLVSDGATSHLGHALVAGALLLRGGIVPLHGWIPRLFENATFATAMLFVLPLVEVAAAIRILLPTSPGWILDASAWVVLVTAIYGGGMALVQTDMRRLFAFLCVSQTSLVLFGVLLRSANGLTAALCLWVSTTLSLAGLAFSIRALEARFGRLALDRYHGHYAQVPTLAIGFLVTGLACVGFPGTVGFLPMELLFAGSVDHGLGVSFALAAAAMLNGIAILRAYFALFTGCRPKTSIAVPATRHERVGIVLVTLIVFAGTWLSPEMVASRHAVAESLLQRTASSLPP